MIRKKKPNEELKPVAVAHDEPEAEVKHPMEFILGQYIKRLHGQLQQAGPDRPVADLLLEGEEILRELKLEPQLPPVLEPLPREAE